MRLTTLRPAPDFDAFDIHGRRIHLKDFRGRRVMISFFRDAACPFCNLRVYELSHHYKRLSEQGLEIIALFKSSPDDIRRYVAKRPRPFIMVGDEEMHIYKSYGVEHSMGGMFRGMFFRMPRMIRAMFYGFLPHMRGDQTLIPADFLIDEKGFIRAVHYGRDIGDHIPMSSVLSFIKNVRTTVPSDPRPLPAAARD